MLTLGAAHGDEVTAKDGESWYGLFLQPQTELRKGTLVIVRQHDPVMDEKPEDKSGKEVRFKVGDTTFSGGEQNAPIALLRGKGLSAGPVTSYGIGWHTEVMPGSSYYLDNKYTLIGTGIAVPGDTYSPVNVHEYCVRLVMNQQHYNESRKLFCLDRIDTNAGMAAVIFSGDLDRDGLPDFILSGSGHYNQNIVHLFLSSPNKDQIEHGWPKKVAEFSTVGC